MKRIILLILTGICFQISFGQIFIGRQVVSSTGGSSGSGAIRATSTVGETVTGTFVQPSLVVTQGFQQTNASVSPSNQDVTFNAGTTNFTVNVPAGSGWAATSDKFWCSVTPAGSGIGIVTANYLENELLDQRIAYITVTISGQAPVVVTVTQSGAPGPSSWIPLPYPENNMSVIGKIQLSPGVYSLNENDILGAFVGNECRGVASPFSSLGGILFLTIGSNEESGEIVTFKIYLASTNEIVDANNEIPFVSSTDIGTMDDPIIFTYGLQCELSVTPSNQNVPYSPNGSTTFSVTTSCSWSATSDQEWCSVTPSGTGNGTMIANYIINPTTTERTANITVSVVGIAPKVVTITQSPAPCSITVNPTNQNVPYSPGSSTTFSISSNCPWTATSDKEWCTVTPSGAGNGTMDATYTENNTNLERIATINLAIAGVPSFVVTVTQSGLPGTTDNILLHAGWNLISLDVIPDPSTPESVFQQLIEDGNLIFVTGYDQEGLVFDPNDIPELNTLVNLTPGMGYWVKVINEAVLNVTGEQIPTSFSINLTTGWNLVAYWPEEPLPPEDAFGSLITAGILQVVTGYDQEGQIFEPNEPYFNTLTEIRNGYGYWVKVTADYDGFTYPQTEWTCGMTIFDERDNKTYETVQIGTQCWMKQNLNIGTRIDGINNQTNNGAIEKYCYNNLETNCDVYGGLYQWDEMMHYTSSSGSHGICPVGFHIPTDNEWTLITEFLEGWEVAGGNLKEIGYLHWSPPNSGATNLSGFTAIPGGMRHSSMIFTSQSIVSIFWSSSLGATFYPWTRDLHFNTPNIMRSSSTDKSYGCSVRCLKNDDNQVSLPTVTTFELSEISTTTAISGGNVTLDGGAVVNARGVCWSTSQNPTIENYLTISGTGTGTFISNIISLEPGTTYYVRAFATNSEGTAYGNELIFSTPIEFLCGDNFTDSRDGKVYSTVQIGSQCWMKQNLNIGTRIDGASNQTNNGTIEKYCYNNLESNCLVYGGLYQWNEMMQYVFVAGEQGICADGWHLPSDEEWTALTDHIKSQEAYLCNSSANYIAKAMAAKTAWSTSAYLCAPGNNINANNSTNFTALPGGYRFINGASFILGINGSWFSSTEYSTSDAFYRYLDHNTASVGSGGADKSFGYSVRCIK